MEYGIQWNMELEYGICWHSCLRLGQLKQEYMDRCAHIGIYNNILAKEETKYKGIFLPYFAPRFRGSFARYALLRSDSRQCLWSNISFRMFRLTLYL